MSTKRVAWGAAGVLAALLVAGGGAVMNVRWMQPDDRPAAPLSLSRAVASTTSPSVLSHTEGPNGTTTSIAGATIPPPTDTTAPATPPPTSPPTTAPAATATPYVVGSAGTVTLSVRGDALTVASVRLAGGWTYATEHQSGDEIELRFRRSSDGAEASLRARLENGLLRVEIDDDGAEPPDD